MKQCISRGVEFTGASPIPNVVPITLRIKKTPELMTLSLSNDKDIMLMIDITPEVKRILKGVL